MYAGGTFSGYVGRGQPEEDPQTPNGHTTPLRTKRSVFHQQSSTALQHMPSPPSSLHPGDGETLPEDRQQQGGTSGSPANSKLKWYNSPKESISSLVTALDRSKKRRDARATPSKEEREKSINIRSAEYRSPNTSGGGGGGDETSAPEGPLEGFTLLDVTIDEVVKRLGSDGSDDDEASNPLHLRFEKVARHVAAYFASDDILSSVSRAIPAVPLSLLSSPVSRKEVSPTRKSYTPTLHASSLAPAPPPPPPFTPLPVEVVGDAIRSILWAVASHARDPAQRAGAVSLCASTLHLLYRSDGKQQQEEEEECEEEQEWRRFSVSKRGGGDASMTMKKSPPSLNALYGRALEALVKQKSGGTGGAVLSRSRRTVAPLSSSVLGESTSSRRREQGTTFSAEAFRDLMDRIDGKKTFAAAASSSTAGKGETEDPQLRSCREAMEHFETRTKELTERLDDLQDRFDHELMAHDRIVMYWQRYTTKRVFKAWRATAVSERDSRRDEEIRMLKEKNTAQLRQVVEEKIRCIDSLEAKLGSLRFIAQQDRLDHQAALEAESIMSKRLDKELALSLDNYDRLQEKNLQLQAKNTFLRSELDRTTDERAARRNGGSDDVDSRASRWSSPTTEGPDMGSDLLVEAMLELVEDMCDSLAPMVPTATVPTQAVANIWMRLAEGAISNPKLNLLEACHQEKLSSFSYDPAPLLKAAGPATPVGGGQVMAAASSSVTDSDGSPLGGSKELSAVEVDASLEATLSGRFRAPMVSGGSREVPFPAGTGQPDAVQLFLASNVCFSTCPPDPTVCIRRSEPSKVAELRERVIDSWNRARKMDSLRTRVGFDIVKELVDHRGRFGDDPLSSTDGSFTMRDLNFTPVS